MQSGWTRGSSPRVTEEGWFDFIRTRLRLNRLHHLAHQLGADLVAELVVDRGRGGAEGREIGVIDLHALLGAEGAAFRGFLRHRRAPDRLDFGSGLAYRLLVGGLQPVEFDLARHQGAGVVDVVGEAGELRHLVDFRGNDGEERQLDAADGLLRDADIDFRQVHHHRDGAAGAKACREYRAGLDADL